jgi:hypothetical protein
MDYGKPYNQLDKNSTFFAINFFLFGFLNYSEKTRENGAHIQRHL